MLKKLFIIPIILLLFVATVSATTYTSEYPPSHSGTYVKAYSYHSANYAPWLATDPSTSLTGGAYDNAWLTLEGGGNITNQRYHIDLGSSKTITRIYYENYHSSGSDAVRSSKNFTFWGSNDASSFENLTYSNNTGWTQITTNISQFTQHPASDTEDPQYVTLTNSVAYRYYAVKIDNGWGTVSSIGLRRIELQSGGSGDPWDGYVTPSLSGEAPLVINFTDISYNSPTSWNWSFKDVTGNNTEVWFSQEQNPSWSFNQGNFSIRFNSSNSWGFNITPIIVFVNVSSTAVAPVADFSISNSTGNSPLLVNFIDTSTNTPTSWNWTMGGANFSNSHNPTHTFTGAGNYTIILNASNSAGFSTKTKYVEVSPAVIAPVAEWSANITSGPSPLPVSFTDASVNATSWSWAYKNATVGWTVFSTSQNPTYTFPTGIYSINLTATNSAGSNDKIRTNYISTDVIPTSSFTAAPLSGDEMLSVTFTGTTTGTVTHWAWKYKNATSGWVMFSEAQLVTYSLPAGVYDILLISTNDGGSNTTTEYSYITVTSLSSHLPVANFTSNKTMGSPTLPIQFNDTSQTSISAWNWSFGDGLFSTTQNPTHDYTSSGIYTVILTVQNASGVSDITKNNYITVNGTGGITAAFIASPSSSLTTPTSVSFTDLSVGTGIDSWYWEFGDGSTSTSHNPVHNYSSVGLYTVSLTTVSSSLGSTDKETKINYVNIQSPIVPGGYNYTGGVGTVDIVNSTYTKDWLYYLIVSNKTSVWDFPIIGFSSSIMGPFADAFTGLGITNLIYLILWGLFIMMVWRQSGKITIPAMIACITAGAWSLLFPQSSQPWVLILLAAALASQLMTFFAKE